MKTLSAILATASLSMGGFALHSFALAQDPAPDSPAYYDAKIKPVLSANCYKCHTEKMAGGLRLDSRDAILKGGDSGPAIVVGDPAKSLLVTAIHQTDPDLKMRSPTSRPGSRPAPSGGPRLPRRRLLLLRMRCPQPQPQLRQQPRHRRSMP
jgi:hypothetical protein